MQIKWISELKDSAYLIMLPNQFRYIVNTDQNVMFMYSILPIEFIVIVILLEQQVNKVYIFGVYFISKTNVEIGLISLLYYK